ncbi:MAG TPA: zinc ribbon domain-containing protein [Terriglobales bacterium]|nr:zinc ribbon domain-containing protein [Terriglobales bacterium]
MPIFEYICKECGHHFEVLVMGSKKSECPSCRSAKLEQQLSAFAVGPSKSTSSLPSPGPCGSCGDPRGPGSCSMN